MSLNTLVIDEQVNANGRACAVSRTITSPRLISAAATVPAAKTGTIGSRTDNDTAVVAADPGHGFANSDKLDLFWDGGSRRGMTASVSSNNVTVDGGSGDNLPIVGVPVTVMKPVNYDLDSVNGDDLVGLVADNKSGAKGYITFWDDAGTPAIAPNAIYGPATGKALTWDNTTGADNPLDSLVITAVRFSHGDSSGAKEMAALLYLN